MNMHCIGRSLSITFLDLIMLIIKIILYGVIGVLFTGFCCSANCFCTKQRVLYQFLTCSHPPERIFKFRKQHRINTLNFKMMDIYLLCVYFFNLKISQDIYLCPCPL